MEIKKHLTKVNYDEANNTKRIRYIVIHYVGATGGAEDNCKYFYSTYRGVSAHYFVGHKGEVWQCVDDGDIAWHCGSRSGYKHQHCRNANSIGIELCCRKDGNWYFEDATVASAIELTKMLMKRYNIPEENVIRHYDVTGKNCPAPYVANNTKHTWADFKKKISQQPISGSSTNTTTKVVYRVRKSWTDASSQIGAYSDLNNAKIARDKAGTGYYVFDNSGKAIYPVPTTTTTSTLTTGSKLNLSNIALYASSSATNKASNITGTYYVWSTGILNNKIRITNSSANVGKLGQVTGWISVNDAKKSLVGASISYKVKVIADVLNVRAGAGTNYKVADVIKDQGIYTIVEEKNGWGRLKSGKGWISLKYTKRV